ncbi:MAG: amidohydrolase family protein [Bacteroidota bacterium]
MVIDAHQHFWQYDAVRHGWIDDEMAVIRRDFGPGELSELYAENEVDGCVAVQADQTEAETNFLLDLANQHAFVKGIVGWVDLRQKNVETVLGHYRQFPQIKGWRHVVQAEPDHNFLLRPDFLRGISSLETYGYTYDILVFPHQLGAVLELVRRFPNQAFVIDHLAKPYIKDGFYDGWARLMKAIASYKNVFCKLSGMVTEADYQTWTVEEIRPYADLVLESFGPQRILYGSDWPVCLVAGTYSKVKSLAMTLIGELSESEQAAIMGENAISFYTL